MPRAKSELTGSKINIGLRMTPDQTDMFKALAGIDWLRNYINRQLLSEEIQIRQENVSRSKPT